MAFEKASMLHAQNKNALIPGHDTAGDEHFATDCPRVGKSLSLSGPQILHLERGGCLFVIFCFLLAVEPFLLMRLFTEAQYGEQINSELFQSKG